VQLHIILLDKDNKPANASTSKYLPLEVEALAGLYSST